MLSLQLELRLELVSLKRLDRQGGRAEVLHCYPTVFEEYFAYIAYPAILDFSKTAGQAVLRSRLGLVTQNGRAGGVCKVFLKMSMAGSVNLPWLYCLPFRFRRTSSCYIRPTLVHNLYNMKYLVTDNLNIM